MMIKLYALKWIGSIKHAHLRKAGYCKSVACDNVTVQQDVIYSSKKVHLLKTLDRLHTPASPKRGMAVCT